MMNKWRTILVVLATAKKWGKFLSYSEENVIDEKHEILCCYEKYIIILLLAKASVATFKIILIRENYYTS